MFSSYRSTRSVSWKIPKLIVSLKLETMFLFPTGNGSCHKSRFAGQSNQLAHAYLPFLSPRICKVSCHLETYYQDCDCHFFRNIDQKCDCQNQNPNSSVIKRTNTTTRAKILVWVEFLFCLLGFFPLQKGFRSSHS